MTLPQADACRPPAEGSLGLGVAQLLSLSQVRPVGRVRGGAAGSGPRPPVFGPVHSGRGWGPWGSEGGAGDGLSGAPRRCRLPVPVGAGGWEGGAASSGVSRLHGVRLQAPRPHRPRARAPHSLPPSGQAARTREGQGLGLGARSAGEAGPPGAHPHTQPRGDGRPGVGARQAAGSRLCLSFPSVLGASGCPCGSQGASGLWSGRLWPASAGTPGLRRRLSSRMPPHSGCGGSGGVWSGFSWGPGCFPRARRLVRVVRPGRECGKGPRGQGPWHSG